MDGFFDGLSVAGLIFTLIICIVWVIIAQRQYAYKSLSLADEQTKILSTQAALYLPLYAIIVWITLLAPDLDVIMDIPMSIVEAFAFYGFVSMIVNHLGGPKNCLEELKEGYHHRCGCCCPENPVKFYDSLIKVLWAFCFVRVPFVILGAVSELEGFDAGVAITKAITVFILIWTLVAVIQFYHSVMTKCPNIYGFNKLIILKGAVGLIVFQGVILQLIEASDKLTVKDDDKLEAEEKAGRVLDFLILCEFVLIAIPYYYVYGCEMRPRNSESIQQQKIENSNATFASFLYALFDVFNVARNLSASDNAKHTELSSQQIQI